MTGVSSQELKAWRRYSQGIKRDDYYLSITVSGTSPDRRSRHKDQYIQCSTRNFRYLISNLIKYVACENQIGFLKCNNDPFWNSICYLSIQNITYKNVFLSKQELSRPNMTKCYLVKKQKIKKWRKFTPTDINASMLFKTSYNLKPQNLLQNVRKTTLVSFWHVSCILNLV